MTERPGQDNGNNYGNDNVHYEHPLSRHISPDSSLQQLVAQQAQAQAMPTTARVTNPLDRYQSRPFAELWYSARAAGERIRAIALERLYCNRPRPGGPPSRPTRAGCLAKLYLFMYINDDGARKIAARYFGPAGPGAYRPEDILPFP